MQIPISPENYQIFNSLASPTRLQILNLLAEGPSNIHSLAQAVGITPTMAVKHIRQLEAAGLVVSETLPGKRGMQKLCRLKDTHLVLTFTTREESANCCSYSMPVGMYVDCDVKAPCGLATTSSIIRLADDPAFFMCAYGEAASQVGNNHIHLFIFPAVLPGSFSAHSLLIQHVTEAFTIDGRNARHVGDFFEFIGADAVVDVGRNSQRRRNSVRNERAQI